MSWSSMRDRLVVDCWRVCRMEFVRQLWWVVAGLFFMLLLPTNSKEPEIAWVLT